MTGGRGPSGGRPMLLAVDDSRLVREIIRDYFAREGFDITEAADGASALESLRALPAPDAIVADVLMPGMDGWELYREVRSNPATADVPFVFLTVEADPPKRVQALRLGADDYVVKPFDVAELHARVVRLTERRAAAGRDVPLAGSLDFLPLADLLQLLALNGRDVELGVRRNGDSGEIVLEGGELLHARCGRASGRKALYRILGWKEGAFRVRPLARPPAERTLQGPAAQVVMDGLVALDEWNRFRESLPPTGSTLRRTRACRSRSRGRETTPAERGVLARLARPLGVGDLLEESPLPDAELAEAICSLLEAGIVEAV